MFPRPLTWLLAAIAMLALTGCPSSTPVDEDVVTEEPSDPSEPSDPTDPGEPGEPDNPGEPEDPSDPNDPTDPGDPPTDEGAPPDAPILAVTARPIKTLTFEWDDVADETSYVLYVDADGDGTDADPTEITTLAADATSYEMTLFLPDASAATYSLEACNADGCSDPASATPAALDDAIGYVKPSDPRDDNQFGQDSIALSDDGTTLAVGVPRDDGVSSARSNSGAVYVFVRTDGVWTEEDLVRPSSPAADDFFGVSVSLSADGSTLAVGASGENSLAGAAYVFTRSSGTWSQIARVTGDETEAGDNFGSGVSLSDDGTVLAIGAYGEDSADPSDQTDDSKSAAGAAYVFETSGSGTSWTQTAYIKASNVADAGDAWFGRSVSIADDGNTIAIGARRENSGASLQGAAYVFLRTDTGWDSGRRLEASNAAGSDRFGGAVVLSGDGTTLAVGAATEDGSANGIDGGDDDAASDAGAVYVFTRSGDTWSQQAYVKASNSGAFDRFGSSLAISDDGTELAVGAPQEDGSGTGLASTPNDSGSAVGAAYLFALDGTTWAQKAYVKASNGDDDDRFGGAISLSGDGETLAVGAGNEDSGATIIDDDATDDSDQADDSLPDAGAVYLY